MLWVTVSLLSKWIFSWPPPDTVSSVGWNAMFCAAMVGGPPPPPAPPPPPPPPPPPAVTGTVPVIWVGCTSQWKYRVPGDGGTLNEYVVVFGPVMTSPRKTTWVAPWSENRAKLCGTPESLLSNES